MTPEEQKRVLREHEVPLADWFVLSLVGLWPFPAATAARTAASHSEGDPLGSISSTEADRSVSECLQRNWLRVVDRTSLSKIREGLLRKPALGPIYGLPRIGDLDFTPRGARLFLRVRSRIHETSLTSQHVFVVERKKKTHLFTVRLEAAKKAAEQAKKGLRTVSGPTKIGPWRIYWWERFSKGYRVAVTKGPDKN